MSIERELLKELITKDMVQYYYPKLVKNVEAILAQPEQTEQEPVEDRIARWHKLGYEQGKRDSKPKQTEPLKDAEIAKLWVEAYSGTTQMVRNVARAIEKAHGIGGGE
jgi:hypothetical protein